MFMMVFGSCICLAGEAGQYLGLLWNWILAFWQLLRQNGIFWKPSMMTMLLLVPAELHIAAQLP